MKFKDEQGNEWETIRNLNNAWDSVEIRRVSPKNPDALEQAIEAMEIDIWGKDGANVKTSGIVMRHAVNAALKLSKAEMLAEVDDRDTVIHAKIENHHTEVLAWMRALESRIAAMENSNKATGSFSNILMNTIAGNCLRCGKPPSICTCKEQGARSKEQGARIMTTTKKIEQRARDYSRSFNYSLQAEDHYLAGARAEVQAFKKRVLEQINATPLAGNLKAMVKDILEEASK